MFLAYCGRLLQSGEAPSRIRLSFFFFCQISMSLLFVRALRSGARPLLGLGPSRARLLCAAAKPPPSSGKGEPAGTTTSPHRRQPAGMLFRHFWRAAIGEERVEDSIATTASTQERAPGGLAVYNEDEENLPPLKFEPGVVGAAQKGVSAVVIAFGACAFGACFWGVSQALFPSATSTQVIFSEALDKARHRARPQEPAARRAHVRPSPRP